MNTEKNNWRRWCMRLSVMGLLTIHGAAVHAQQEISDEQRSRITAVEDARIEMIERVSPSVVAIFGDSPGAGGGSGVIVDPAGYAVTNFHVVQPAGVKGQAGLKDGVLYDWDLVGMDPGGDLAIIKLKGKDAFPYSLMGNSRKVRVGEFAFAMGNPFLLAEDYKPTITMGTVSGINRYQPGMTDRLLVYTECIQVDTSINPGNSGGPLYNMRGHVIGINGRGSFEERGRVNVGVGYAISMEQVRNFIPALFATHVTQHGTLEATFRDSGKKVICAEIDRRSPIAAAGLSLGDQLIEFDGLKITHTHDFTNRIWTLPARWPVKVVWLDKTNQRKEAWVRLTAVEYQQSGNRGNKKRGERSFDNQGAVNDKNMNYKHMALLLRRWKEFHGEQKDGWRVVETVIEEGIEVGKREMIRDTEGRYMVHVLEGYGNLAKGTKWGFDGEKQWMLTADGRLREDVPEVILDTSPLESKLWAASLSGNPLGNFKNGSLQEGDKAEGRRAYRLWLKDRNDQEMYVWISLLDQEKEVFENRVIKFGTEINGNGTQPNIVYDDYREVNGTRLPMTRRQVRGIGDSELIRAFHTVEIESLKSVKSERFAAPEVE